MHNITLYIVHTLPLKNLGATMVGLVNPKLFLYSFSLFAISLPKTFSLFSEGPKPFSLFSEGSKTFFLFSEGHKTFSLFSERPKTFSLFFFSMCYLITQNFFSILRGAQNIFSILREAQNLFSILFLYSLLHYPKLFLYFQASMRWWAMILIWDSWDFPNTWPGYQPSFQGLTWLQNNQNHGSFPNIGRLWDLVISILGDSRRKFSI